MNIAISPINSKSMITVLFVSLYTCGLDFLVGDFTSI